MKNIDLSKKKKYGFCEETDRAHIELTLKCNNNCIFCLQGHFPDEINRDLEDVKKEIDECEKSGVNKLILSGGEPTIHPNFLEIIKYSKNKGFHTVQTISNGRMFSVEQFTNSAISAGLDEITLSIHGSNPKTHDYLVNTPGAFDQLIKAAKILQSKKIIVSFDIGIFNRNYKELPDIVQLIHDLGFKCDIDLIGCRLSGNAFDYKKEVLPNYENASVYIKKALKIIHTNKTVGWVLRAPLKYIPGYEFYKQDDDKLPEVAPKIEEFFKSIPPECFGEICNYCELQPLCENLNQIKKHIFESKERKLSFIINKNREHLVKIFNTVNDFISEIVIKNNLDNINENMMKQIQGHKIILEDIKDINEAKLRLEKIFDKKKNQEIVWNYSFVSNKKHISDSLGIDKDVLLSQFYELKKIKNKSIKIYLTKRNLIRLDKIISKFIGLGFHMIVLSMKNPTNIVKRELSWYEGVKIKDNMNLVISENIGEKIKQVIDGILEKNKNKDLFFEFSGIPKCYLSKELYENINLKYGKDLFKDSLSSDVFNEDGKISLSKYSIWSLNNGYKEQYYVCNNCEFNYECPGDYTKTIKLRSYKNYKLVNCRA